MAVGDSLANEFRSAKDRMSSLSPRKGENRKNSPPERPYTPTPTRNSATPDNTIGAGQESTPRAKRPRLEDKQDDQTDEEMQEFNFGSWAESVEEAQTEYTHNPYDDQDLENLPGQLQTVLGEAQAIIESIQARNGGAVTVTQHTAQLATQIANTVTDGEWRSPRHVMEDVLTMLHGVADSVKDLTTHVNQVEGKIEKRFEALESRLKHSAPSAPSYAQITAAHSTPSQPKSKGENPQNGQEQRGNHKAARANPLEAHHPSRLVVRIIPNGLPKEARPEEDKLVQDINNALQRHSEARHLRVVSVKWNASGNCILFTRADQTAQELVKYAKTFQQLIGQGRPTEARPDQRWYKIQVNDIRTGSFSGPPGSPPTVYTAEMVHKELCDNNPYYAKLDFIQKPRWMRREEDLMHTVRSSVVFAITNEEQASYLIRNIKYLAAFGRNASMRRYADKPPIVQCTNCYSYGHTADKCTNGTRCRLCGQKHTAEEHQAKCEECAQAKASLDSMDMDADIIQISLPCTHDVKCIHCPEGQEGCHPADHRRCPERIRQYGTTRTNERPNGKDSTDPPKQIRKSKTTGPTSTTPTAQNTTPKTPKPSVESLQKHLAEAGLTIEEDAVREALNHITGMITE